MHPNVEDEEEEEFEEEEGERHYTPNEERMLHRRDLQVYRKLNQLRSGILFTAPFAGLLAAAYWVLLPSMRDAKLYELSSETGYLMVTASAQSLAAVVACVASLMILKNPMLLIWATAITQTIAAGAAWWGFTQGGLQLWGLLFGLLAAAQLALAVLVNGDARDALAENPDFYDDQEADKASHARERHEDRPPAHWIAPAKAWALTTIVGVSVYFAAQGLAIKPTYAANSQTFVNAFSQGDLTTINRFFTAKPKLAGQFEKYAKNHGWMDNGWPAISESGAFERTDSAYVTYAADENELIGVWQRVGDDWQLGGFGSKTDTYEDIEAALRDHKETWRVKYAELGIENTKFIKALAAGDVEAVQAMRGSNNEIFGSFQPFLENEKWATDGWPMLSVTNTKEAPITVWGGEVFQGFRITVTYGGGEHPIEASWGKTPTGWMLFRLEEQPIVMK